MALSILKYIGGVIKKNNVFFDNYSVNSIQLTDGTVISFDDNPEKKYDGISDNLGTAFYIRSNPLITYVDNPRKKSSLRKTNNATKTCRLVAYTFKQNANISSEKLVQKLLTDLNRIRFLGLPGNKPEITIKKSNNNYIDNFFDETKKGLDYGTSFVCVSIDFEIKYYDPGCNDCDVIGQDVDTCNFEEFPLPPTPIFNCSTVESCDFVTDIKNNIIDLQDQINNLPAGMTCEEISDCEFIEVIRNDITGLQDEINNLPVPLTCDQISECDFVQAIYDSIPTVISQLTNDIGYITDTSLAPYLTIASASATYEPIISTGTITQYWRGDKSWQTLDTGSVPENGNLYFTEPRVLGTVLTGLSITGGSIASTDNIISAFGKIQNQINGVLGGAMYQGVWNASTNTPNLASGVGIKGHYYVVSVNGTTNLDGIIDWKIGDWAIFNGATWDKVDNTDAVISVNGFIGIVNLVTTDIPEGSNLYYTNARGIGSLLTGYVSGAGIVAATDSVLQAIQKINGNVSTLSSQIPILSSTQIAFGSNTNTVASSSNFTWNDVTKTLSISGATHSFVMSTDSGSGFIQMTTLGGFTIYNKAGNAGIALANAGITNFFVPSGIVTTFQSGSAKFAASIDGSGGYFQPLIGGLGMALYNAAGTSSISVDGAGGSTITNNLKVVNGTVNIGNATTVNQRIVRIGQDTAFMDIGSRVNSISQAAIYFNQSTPTVNNFIIAADATNLLINSPVAGSSTTFLAGGGTYMIGTANTINFVPTNVASSAITNFIFTKPNNTNQTATTNISGLLYNGGSRQWATGTIPLQQEILWGATNYSAVSSSVMTVCFGNYFNAPIVGTNMTITNRYAIGMTGYLQMSIGTVSNQGFVIRDDVGTSSYTAMYSGVNPSTTNYFIRSNTTITDLQGGTTLNFNSGGSTCQILTSSVITFNVKTSYTNAVNIAFGTTTGSIIGETGLQKFAFWGKLPIVQPTNSILALSKNPVGGTNIQTNDTYGGYTVGQFFAAAINSGFLF